VESLSSFVWNQCPVWCGIRSIIFNSALNLAYKHWAEIFNHDSTLTSALLDRLLHHAETVIIEGKSYRMKDQIEA
jgi:DNA replication protein DnaC